MTRDENQFISLEVKKERIVTFGDNAKDKIVGIGKVPISSSSCIDNVLLVEGLNIICLILVSCVTRILMCPSNHPYAVLHVQLLIILF